jgi:tetratricopeptide (TPR) repeat protein
LKTVAREREAVRQVPSPEHHLEKAVAARTVATRAKYAKLGLSVRGPIDKTTQAMLLRQLYLAHFEARRFEEARDVAGQLVRLRVLTDVAHQDAARACQALGRISEAIGHLRLAARLGPASRRAFHYWTLGGLLYLEGRHTEAAATLLRAARWGTTDKPLYLAHAALAQCAQGRAVENLGSIINQLAAVACGQGYGRFVLGRLCCYARRRDDAIRYLDAFVRRTTEGRPALRIALEAEVNEAQVALRTLQDN